MTPRLFATVPLLACFAAHAAETSVLTYHNSNSRQGLYTVPGLTAAAAASMKLDPGFVPSVSGNIYAQPLFYKPKGGAAELIIATENNLIYALNPITGATLWQTQLPAAVPASQLTCGDIDPEGVTGTPVIDPTTGTLYLDSLSNASGSVLQYIYAISLADGSIVPGWPMDVQAALTADGVTFAPISQGERSALLQLNGKIYATYGGRAGDCQPYKGVIVEIDPTTQAMTGFWQTRAAGGGIWSQGGIASTGGALFTTTGNTSATSTYGDGESIISLQPGLAAPTSTKDYYAPANWLALDQADLDLGSTEGVPVNLIDGNGKNNPSVISFGKDGNAYLVNRNNLGGIGGAATIFQVATGHIITAPAIYPTTGGDMVAISNTSAVGCPGNTQADSVMMLKLAPPSAGTPISVLWCTHYSGNAAPIITTSDGTSDPIVWVAGTQLHGFDVPTGNILSSGHGATLTGINRYGTMIAVGHRLYIPANNTVYAFTFKPS